jgi:hypothetical protein
MNQFLKLTIGLGCLLVVLFGCKTEKKINSADKPATDLIQRILPNMPIVLLLKQSLRFC